MEIVLVRHGQPDWEPDGRAVDDPDLTPAGQRQAEACADVLAVEPFDVVYASPLQRVLQTARPTLERSGHEPIVRDWLREIELPSLQGQTPEQVQAYFRDVNARALAEHWDGPPGGESFHHFYERVSSGIEGLLLGDHRLGIHSDGAHRLWQRPESLDRVLIFAHEGTNSVIISHLLGLDPIPFSGLRFPSEWGRITRLELRPVAGAFVWSLAAFNLPPAAPGGVPR